MPARQRFTVKVGYLTAGGVRRSEFEYANRKAAQTVYANLYKGAAELSLWQGSKRIMAKVTEGTTHGD